LAAWLVIYAVVVSATPVVVVHRTAVAAGWTPLARYTGADAPPIFRESSPALADLMLTVAVASAVWLAAAPAGTALIEVARRRRLKTWVGHLEEEMNCQVWGRWSASVWFLLLIASQAGWSPSPLLGRFGRWFSHVGTGGWIVAIAGAVVYFVLWLIVEVRADQQGIWLPVILRFLMRLAPGAVLSLLVSAFTVALIAFFVPIAVFPWVFQRQSKQVVEALQKLASQRAEPQVADGARVVPLQSSPPTS